MLIKNGSMSRTKENNETVVLINPEGQHFKISYTAHMVWSMLDGATELDDIAQKIGAIAEIETPRMKTLVEEIVRGLKQVDLVS